MIIFRPLRLTLDESMADAAIFDSVDLMLEHVVKINTYAGIGPMFSVDDLSIGDKASFDRAVGWKDCRAVLTAQFDSEECTPPKCVGYCATVFPRESY